MIEVSPPLCRLMDIASTNGTFVNQRRVLEIDLRDGDVIEGGDTAISVRIDEVEANDDTRRPEDDAPRRTLAEPQTPPRQTLVEPKQQSPERKTLAEPPQPSGDDAARQTQAETTS